MTNGFFDTSSYPLKWSKQPKPRKWNKGLVVSRKNRKVWESLEKCVKMVNGILVFRFSLHSGCDEYDDPNLLKTLNVLYVMYLLFSYRYIHVLHDRLVSFMTAFWWFRKFWIDLTDFRCYTVQLQYNIYITLNIHCLIVTTYRIYFRMLPEKEKLFANNRSIRTIIRTIISSSLPSLSHFYPNFVPVWIL